MDQKFKGIDGGVLRAYSVLVEDPSKSVTSTRANGSKLSVTPTPGLMASCRLQGHLYSCMLIPTLIHTNIHNLKDNKEAREIYVTLAPHPAQDFL